MSISGYDWFPPADRLYATESAPVPTRDVFQGDIFQGVPCYRYPHNLQESEVDPRGRIGTVMALGHPCEISAEEKGTNLPWRLVCPVAEDRDRRISLDGSGDFGAFPLPNLFQDEDLWYADFRFLCTVDARYLDPTQRVAALSLEGWLALQRRLVHFLSRVKADWNDLNDAGVDLHPDA